MRLDRCDAAFLIGLVLGVTLVVGFGILDYRAALVRGNDFATVWTGARVASQGGDPYDAATFAAAGERYDTVRPGIGRETYPPWVMVAFLPLALLDIELASMLWTLLGLSVAVLAMRALVRAFVPDLPLMHSLAGFALLAPQPGLATFFSGQWTFVLLATLVVAVLALRGDRPLLAALATVPLMAKPQLFVFALWALSFRAIAERRVLFVVGWISCWAVVVIATAIVAWQWLRVWAGSVALNDKLGDSSVPSIGMASANVFGALSVPIVALTIAVTLAVALRFDPRSDAWLAVWITLTVLLATYIRSYDQLLLLVPLVIGVGSLDSYGARRQAILLATFGALVLLLGSTLLYGVAALRGSEDLSVLVPAGMYALLVIALWRVGRAT